MNEAHDELWVGSETPTPMLLPKGNGNQSPRTQVMPQKQKVNKPPAPEKTAPTIPLSQAAVNSHSDSKVEVHGSGRSKGKIAVSNPREPRATKVPTAKPWSPFWFAQRLRDQPRDRAIALLHTAAHPKRSLEVSDFMLRQLNELTVEDAAAAIQELHGPKRYIRGISPPCHFNA